MKILRGAEVRRFYRPTTLADALAVMVNDPVRLLAGGTDFYSLQGEPQGSDALLWIGAAGLGGIALDEGWWRIGAATTWADLIRAPLPPAFDGLKAAAREVGSVQIQNSGTVGGNLCNASPAADGVPPLLALDAEVELASLRGVRRLALSAFLLGPRRTAREPDEILTAVIVPEPAVGARSGFVKLGARTHLVISIGMAAVTLTPDGRGRVAAARVAVGACSAVAMRLPAVEAALGGLPMDGPSLASAVDPAGFAPLAPIDDVRATAAYRRRAAVEIVRRALVIAAGPGAAAA